MKFLLLLVIFSFTEKTNSQVDTTFIKPTYQLYAKQVSFTPQELVFDIFIKHTNPAVTRFEYAGGMFFFNFNQLFRNGGTLSFFYKLGPLNDTISELVPRTLIPRNPSISDDTTYLRMAINVYPGAGNGMLIPNSGNNGYGILIARMSFKNLTSSFQGNPGDQIRWRNAIGFYTKIFAYTGLNGTTNSEITDSNTHFIDFISSGILPCSVTWKSNLKISDAGNTTDSLFFGTSPFGTNGIDTCLGERLIPPPPPTGVYDIRFNLPTGDDSKTDLRKDSVAVINWLIKLQPSSSGYPFTFIWNPSSLPLTGYFYLKDIITGTIVNVNMRNQSSYVLSNSGINTLKIEYTPYFINSVSVNSGWNILSVPLKSSNMSVSYLFPGAASPAYSYNNGYVTVDSLKNAKGYWLKFNSSGNYNDTGVYVTPQTISLFSGWNLIGPFNANLPVNSLVVNPPGILASSFFAYSNGYITEDTLKTGKGYWIKSTANGTISGSSGDYITYYSDFDTLSRLIRFEISDNNNNTVNLYLKNQNQTSSQYDLPPVPPAGIFDVRYSTDKYIESLGSDHIIKINSAVYPIVLKSFNLGINKFRIKDAVNGSIIDKEISEGTEIVINEQLDNLILFDDNKIPSTYSLYQNYPNPFNPITLIKYQIPIPGKVRIVLYNILGKEVMVLVDKYHEAGVFEYKLNGLNLASGLYFYKFTSGNYSELKKMVLIK